jgi:hypothetical protein
MVPLPGIVEASEMTMMLREMPDVFVDIVVFRLGRGQDGRRVATKYHKLQK